MSDPNRARARYERPQVADYGTLREITAQWDSAMPMGMGLTGLSSLPTGQPPGGGDTPPPHVPAGPSGGDLPPGGSGPGLVPEAGDVGGDGGGGGGGGETSGEGGDSGVAGAEGGGGAGGGGSTGGDSSLPFTGFPAAVAGAVGAGMAAAGAALRRALRRR